jgi:hypothetical protein
LYSWFTDKSSDWSLSVQAAGTNRGIMLLALRLVLSDIYCNVKCSACNINAYVISVTYYNVYFNIVFIYVLKYYWILACMDFTTEVLRSTLIDDVCSPVMSSWSFNCCTTCAEYQSWKCVLRISLYSWFTDNIVT